MNTAHLFLTVAARIVGTHPVWIITVFLTICAVLGVMLAWVRAEETRQHQPHNISTGVSPETGLLDLWMHDQPDGHRDGIPWYQAPIPRRLHWCQPWTTGTVGPIDVGRCACGAILTTPGEEGWTARNSRRRSAAR